MGTLTVRPRNHLHLHAAAWALDSPHRVGEEDGDAPKRHKGKTSFWKPVVSWSRAVAARADRLGLGPGLNLHLEFEGGGQGRPDDPDEDKRLEPADPVQDSCYLHPVLSPLASLLLNWDHLGSRQDAFHFWAGQSPSRRKGAGLKGDSAPHYRPGSAPCASSPTARARSGLRLPAATGVRPLRFAEGVASRCCQLWGWPRVEGAGGEHGGGLQEGSPPAYGRRPSDRTGRAWRAPILTH